MPSDALSITAAIAAVGAAILSIEDLFLVRRFAPSGILAWRTISLQYRITAVGRLASLLRGIFTPRGDALLSISRLISALGLLVAAVLGRSLWPWALLLVLLLMLLTLRIPYGLDGAHHMYVIVFGALAFLGLHVPESKVAHCVMLFLALEVQLAYLVSGTAKAISHQWRSGKALPSIMWTEIYGHHRLARLLTSHKAASFMAAWLVIAFELAFPALVWLGEGPALVAVGAGILFHATTALAMGLNGFFFAFVATYPAILVFAGVWPGA